MARLFDRAQSEYLEINSAVVNTVPLTMACWFYQDDVTVECVSMCIAYASAQDRWAIGVRGHEAGDYVEAYIRSAVHAEAVVTSTGASVNTWHHACGVFTSSTSREAFIDGGSKGSGTENVDPEKHKNRQGD